MDRDNQNTTQKRRSVIPLLLIIIIVAFVMITQWNDVKNRATSIQQELATQLDEIDIFGKKARDRIAKVRAAKIETERHIDELEANLPQLQNDYKEAVVDPLEISFRLSRLTDKTDTLPLETEAELVSVDLAPIKQTSQESDSPWLKFMHEILGDAKELIHIKKASNPEIALLSPSQIYFIREKLKLNLMLARSSLLSHNEAGFKANLKTAINWINQYYDKNSKPVINMLQKLNQLHDDTFEVVLPNDATILIQQLQLSA